MQIIVRYWLTHPPLPLDGRPHAPSGWLDHSIHPPSRLGLHNAILAAEDWLSILHRKYGTTPHACDIFVEDRGKTVVLDVGEAQELYGLLEHGQLQWEMCEQVLRGATPSEDKPLPAAAGAEDAPAPSGLRGINIDV